MAETSSLKTLVARPWWIMVGPLFLPVALYYIATSGTGWTTLADLFYFLVLGGMALARWVDFHGPDPRNSFGDPAEPGDLRRYLILVGVLGPAVWVAANVLGNHVFAP